MNSKDVHMFFIITEKPQISTHINAGCICYIKEHKYTTDLRRKASSLTKISVVCLGLNSGLDYDLDLSMMEPLSVQEAELLQALAEDSERLRCFSEKKTLQTALSLTTGTAVTVEEEGVKLRGIIRYIGRLAEPKRPHPISGVFFGVELQV